jgi:hypothetical protein
VRKNSEMRDKKCPPPQNRTQLHRIFGKSFLLMSVTE